MALTRMVADKGSIPAGMEAHYIERDGAFHLALEGDTDSEYRTNNIALAKQTKQLTEALKRFEGIDPETARKAIEERRKLEEEIALKAGEFDKVLAGRLQPVKAELERAEKRATDALAAAAKNEARLAAITIDQAIVEEARKRGLRPSAMPDITARGKNTFRLVDGVPQAVDNDGSTIRMAKDGVTPLSIGVWLDTQVSEAPHLFESNAGGGAAGNISGGGATGGLGSIPNPFKAESRNLTEQMRLMKKDPALAERLRLAAG